MSIIELRMEQWEFNRDRTLETIRRIAELSDPQAALSWQPGRGRANIGWQLMHIAITEERFSSMSPAFVSSLSGNVVKQYCKGSVPDEHVPTLDVIQKTLEATRGHLLQSMEQFTEADLGVVPDSLKERGWNIGMALQIIAWHEPHHQGQAHITLNLWEALQQT